VVGHGHLLDLPARRRGAHDHLQRPAEAAVADAQLEQRLAPGGPHRADVADAQARAATHLECQRAVGQARVQRPRAAHDRLTRSEHQPGAARLDRPDHARQLARVEGRVAVHEAHDVRASGAQAREAGRAEAGLGLVDHLRTERGGQLTGAVGRAVVDHERLIAGGHALEHPGQRGALVEDGEDDLAHASAILGVWLRTPSS